MRFSWEFPSSSTSLLCIPASLNVPAGSGEPCLPQNSWTTPLQHLAGRNMIAISWTPSRDHGRALARYFLGSEPSSCLHEFLKRLFPSLSSGTDTDLRQLPTGRRAAEQENSDVETSCESQEGEPACSPRTLWPGLGTQSLTSGLVLFVLAKHRFCCPYSSNSSSESEGLFADYSLFSSR